jgi:BASS family bile acid:Na+ symporter
LQSSNQQTLSPTAQTFSAMTPKVIAAIALVAIMVQLGLALEPLPDRAAKRRERWLVLRALVFNFAVVPALALLAKRGLGASGPGAIALLLLAASPGGRHAPVLTQIGRGDASLSFELTLFSNKLNAFLSPLLAAWLIGRHHVGLRELPYVAQLFVLQIVPFFVARRLRKWRPAGAARAARPAQYTATVAAIVLLAYLIAHHALRGIASFGARGWLAVLVFGTILLLLGWLSGGRDPATRRTLAIAAESRNLALALVIANMTVGDDRVLLAIFGAWVILVALAWVAVALFRLGARRPSPKPTSPLPQPA